ncbi:MAG TPA: MipA/OmpV family protein [Elusimicrobiota bacterium]|jgi:outer membrane scaffolding protein for murein synthesis (MipA/OmpV family)|nr:MipA/OmpV family protein [Elusimicrobiota bacterium]
MKIALSVLAGLALCLLLQAPARAGDGDQYVGIGARLRPAYDGAGNDRVDAIPYLRLYGDHFFGRTTQGMLEGGWRTRPFGGVALGAQMVYEEGRATDDSAFLQEHKVPNLYPSASLGLHAEGDWTLGPMPLNALLRYRHDVQSGYGAQVDLRATAGILDWHQVRAGLFGQLTWSDGDAMQRSFGVAPEQASTTGLPAYNAGSGLRSAQVGLVGDVGLGRHWVGLWGVTRQQLEGSARYSPMTLDRTNWFVNAGAAYRF